MDNQVDTQQPEISFNTPVAVEPVVSIAQQDPALPTLAPGATAPENTTVSLASADQPAPAPTYYVYPASINVIETNDTSDMLKFEIVFNISIYDGPENKNSTIKKMFEVSKSALANEMTNDIATAKVNVVEKLNESKIDNKAVSKRMRELAGIAGKGTYV